MKSGIELITIERQEQIEKHGYSIGGDFNCNRVNQLNHAVVCMITPDERRSSFIYDPPAGWDAIKWQKMINKPYKERLIIAGSLIAAEIDRIQDNEINPLEHENMK